MQQTANEALGLVDSLAPHESPNEQGRDRARDARQELDLAQLEQIEFQVSPCQLTNAKPKQTGNNVTAKLPRSSSAPTVEEHAANDRHNDA
jgi:hypothetical protein